MTNKTAKTQSMQAREAGAFTKRIGYTVYRVGVYYNENAKETAQDKIIRLIKNEAAGKGAKNP